MKKSPSRENRVHVSRAEPRYEVRIRVDSSTREMFVSNYMANLSRGGLFMEMERPFPIGSEVQLAFLLPGINSVINAMGRVVWNYDIKKGTSHITPGVGIQFTGMGSDHKSMLEKYLEFLSRLYQPIGEERPDDPLRNGPDDPS